MKYNLNLFFIVAVMVSITFKFDITTAEGETTTPSPSDNDDTTAKAPAPAEVATEAASTVAVAEKTTPMVQKAMGGVTTDITKDVAGECKGRYNSCLKEKSPKDNAEACTILSDKKNKDCLVEAEKDKGCTMEEYTKMADLACMCPKLAASMVFVVFMAAISKLMAAYR